MKANRRSVEKFKPSLIFFSHLLFLSFFYIFKQFADFISDMALMNVESSSLFGLLMLFRRISPRLFTVKYVKSHFYLA